MQVHSTKKFYFMTSYVKRLKAKTNHCLLVVDYLIALILSWSLLLIKLSTDESIHDE